jgi:hypothetical protein
VAHIQEERQLGITDEISDDAWQSLVDLTLARPDRSPSGGAMVGAD